MNNQQSFYRRRRAKPLSRIFGEAILTGVILALLGAAALTFSATEVTSPAQNVRVIDGDSLRVGNKDIRLWGIDAPEMQQQCKGQKGDYACGKDAQKHLRKLTQNKILTCKGLGNDQYQRLLAVCRAGQTDINAVMVKDGYAFAYGGYAFEEAQAREAKAGIWENENELPQNFRKRTRAQMELAPGMLDALYQWLNRFLS